MTTTGQNFKNIRKKLGLSQDDFAKKLGFKDKQAVSKIENNKCFMSLSVLSRLIIDFNVNLNYLVASVGDMFLPPKFDDIKDELRAEFEKMLKERGL